MSEVPMYSHSAAYSSGTAGAPPSGTSLGPELSVVVISWEADQV